MYKRQENSLFEAGRILVVSMISTFGTVQIAANAVANNLDGMGAIPGKALSLAMITVVGQCVGARDYEQAVHYTRKPVSYTHLIGLVAGYAWQKLPDYRTGLRLSISVLLGHFVGSMVINSLALRIFYGLSLIHI